MKHKDIAGDCLVISYVITTNKTIKGKVKIVARKVVTTINTIIITTILVVKKAIKIVVKKRHKEGPLPKYISNLLYIILIL